MLPDFPIAVLALADGTVFRGHSIGGPVQSVGEVVFNTAMTGYQEILTDPSYARQMVTLTYPHIGNTGINLEDVESQSLHAVGLIIRDLPLRMSNWRASSTLTDYLKAASVPAIAGIDTRRLTRHLRDKGVQAGCIMSANRDVAEPDVEKAISLAREFPGLAGMDLAKEVSVKQAYRWGDGTWQLENGYQAGAKQRFKVVVLDFGVKHNILRLLADQGCELVVLPAQSTLDEVMAHKPDGVFLSNGPGDPEPCDYAIELTRQLLTLSVPMFGICLGHQIMALAAGAKTIKMKLGHHGANHPVKDLDTGRVVITSQNHGFAVDGDSLPESLTLTHKSLFDESVQGLTHRDAPAFSFQGHPEASPGPHDIRYLFERFSELMLNKANPSTDPSGATQ